jgi:hypothetical protein
MLLGTLATIVALAMQTLADSPTRVELSSLSADETAQIERLAGGPFWLLLRDRGDNEVYRLPETKGPTIRRGQVIRVWVSVPLPSSPGVASSERRIPKWGKFERSEASWAQVALTGRDFDDVGGAEDLNRPFRLSGAFRDTELVSLVEFVRSGPELRDANGSRVVNRKLPITAVARKEDRDVDVWLRVSESVFQVVTVGGPIGDAWALVNIQWFQE